MKRRDWGLIGLALASAGAYLLLAAVRSAPGFALDDAWIHQVYARNLATRGEFAFFAGQPSAGSTSPLWTLLLAIGYFARIDFRAWAYLLGALLIGLSAVLVGRLAQRIFPSSLLPFYFLLFTLFEWHLAWSAVSGMEIPLFVFLSLLLLERFYAHERAWVVGLIAALLTLTRPEGIVLAALVALGMASEKWDADRRGQTRKEFLFYLRSHLPWRAVPGSAVIRVLLSFGFAFTLALAPYLFFNLTTSGTILPNTFYAKNVEYAVLFDRAPFVVRWLELAAVPWLGAAILLAPGAVYLANALARRREWRALIPFAWILLLPALYAARLPVAYQHGRYEMPVVPFIALYGIWGTAALFERIKSWVVRTAWAFSVAAVLVAFWLIGADAYATDVAIINCEMVDSARWVAANAPADAVVAAHDIGALGYFYPRPFIDLAGLVTPDVIPFMRDEGRLREFLYSRGATFAIFFPDWYPSLAADPRFVPVYQTDCAVTRREGGVNMVVYKIVGLTAP